MFIEHFLLSKLYLKIPFNLNISFNYPIINISKLSESREMP